MLLLGQILQKKKKDILRVYWLCCVARYRGKCTAAIFFRTVDCNFVDGEEIVSHWHPVGELYSLQIAVSVNDLLVLVPADEAWLDRISCRFCKNLVCKC